MRIIKLLFATLFLTLGCASENDNSLFNKITEKSCLDEGGEPCYPENPDNIALNTSVPEVFVKANQTQFNVGGDCNNGGYVDNAIFWEIQDEAFVVKASVTGEPDGVCSSKSFVEKALQKTQAKCLNGRFNLLITLPTSLRGLGTPRVPHDLRICIYGFKDNQAYPGGSVLQIDLQPN